VRSFLARALGFGLLVNGLIMFTLPAAWYANIPGVAETGPFNAHFVRDIGDAYVVCGLVFLWFPFERAAQAAAQAGTLFLALHAVVHLWDAAAGREHALQLLIDTPTVFLPAILAIWIVSRHRADQKNKGEQSCSNGSCGVRSPHLSGPGTMMRVTSAK